VFGGCGILKFYFSRSAGCARAFGRAVENLFFAYPALAPSSRLRRDSGRAGLTSFAPNGARISTIARLRRGCGWLGRKEDGDGGNIFLTRIASQDRGEFMACGTINRHLCASGAMIILRYCLSCRIWRSFGNPSGLFTSGLPVIQEFLRSIHTGRIHRTNVLEAPLCRHSPEC
jgi:hypothetical protein